ncbi:MAG: type II secretion system F family protein [Alphaproteobacteria bacterium]
MIGANGTMFALVILAALSAGGLAYALLFGRIESESATNRRFKQVRQTNRAEVIATRRAGVDPAKRRKSLQDTLKELENQSKSKDSRVSMSRRIDQAGLALSLRTFYLISALVAFVGAGACLMLSMPLYAAGAAGISGGLGLPRWIINRLRRRRLTKFQTEFANAIDVIVRGVKAGLPLNDCIQIVANETVQPVSGEFQKLVEAQKLGVSIAEAVERMPDMVPIAEVNFFAIVIGIQQRSGGNLSEALGNLSNVLRDRKRMKGKIKAMSMEAKASAFIIAALPFTVMGLVYLTSPEYIMLLFTDRMGHLLLGIGAVWMSMGVLVMRKMINFDF